MPRMTAAEAIHAIRECAYYAGIGVTHSPALLEEAGCAEERVKLAFAVLEEVEAAAQDSPMTSLKECVEARGFLASARARLEAKHDADGR